MDLLAMLILIGAVGAIILYPLVRRSEAVPAGAPPPPDAARARLALTAIKELEFDYETGKIDDDDYQALRARYDARAVEALEHPEPLSSGPSPAPDDATAQIEAEVRAARTRRFCTNCGGALPKTARFCPACGTSVEVKG
ncbi:MAG TPA: zinc-ribbon domain-containing protein [bacterium]|nr:zinc-ribbon domain-containing protein [bacterium]